MLIEVKNVTKAFKNDDSWLFPSYQNVLNGVSITVNEGECVGVVGESGSGKSTLGKVILGLEAADSGEVVLGNAISNLPMHQVMSVVFQDYNTSVNPRLTIREIINEPLINDKVGKAERESHLVLLLEEVGLDADMLDRYPHQLSGGQLQRVCIARAVAPNPKFILLDEAVSSLDVSVQVQVLDLLQKLKQERQISYLFITHDIAVASFLCDRLMFFKDGQIVEQVDDMRNLKHVRDPYTKSLLEAASYLEIPFETEFDPQ
ncbi:MULTISPECIES: ABC transporter ATP-binding protein [unclassified Vibrio]|uniref:ABC transporter ATP-binding protein n=1 Tax=unclassified Vibrio TaxID=2614977 RepID=UPI00159E8BDB|nr:MULTISPECIES: dipeptide/oligopeptide/nickel ABC transporter ATP-binding protein [unclassified Vibrio]NVN83497.1 ABC transporter ATP-binding protein [Vibrio sp. Scap16]QLE94357.1 ABC transporter ATP-binding protein [Vibrio sp. Scap24]